MHAISTLTAIAAGLILINASRPDAPTLTPITVDFHGDAFLTRFGHHCTIQPDRITCNQEKHQVELTTRGLKHTELTNEPQASHPEPAILPAGTRIERGNTHCTVTEQQLECAIRAGSQETKTHRFRGDAERLESNHGEVYTTNTPIAPRGGQATKYGGLSGHKFAMKDPHGGQIACFIPEATPYHNDITYIVCGAKTKNALSGQFRIGTELLDLGTARPQVPFASNPKPGPIEIARGDVRCAGNNETLICQTPLGEFQITTTQAGFDSIHPLHPLPQEQTDNQAAAPQQ